MMIKTYTQTPTNLILESIMQHGKLMEARRKELHLGRNDAQFSLLCLAWMSLTTDDVSSFDCFIHLLKGTFWLVRPVVCRMIKWICESENFLLEISLFYKLSSLYSFEKK